MKTYIKFIGKINNLMGSISAWLLIVMILLICFDVLAKWLAPKLGIQYSNTAVFEAQWYLFAFVFMLGTAFTLKSDRHVRVDVFYANFSENKKVWVNLIGTLLFLIPFCFVTIQTSLIYVRNSFIMHEGSADPDGLPYRFIIKGLIIFGFSLLLLQGIALIFESILKIRGKEA
ncbi:MAG: TRAP-type mannitol/chloroaromatic compound transport system permease small subunit [Bacteroidia bacterium]|jgi:TRAP-type mannitol/chloroaromatic compound transport system permease small subunit